MAADCVQNDVVLHCKSISKSKFYALNSSSCRKTVYSECQASRRECNEWYTTSNSYKPVVCGTSFADVVKANLGQKGQGQARPLVGTQVESKSGEPLELFKEDAKMSYNAAHHANKKQTTSYGTTKSNSNVNKLPLDSSIVCTNKFKPLMGEDSMFDDFDMLDLDIQAGDTVTGDAGHIMSSAHDQNSQNWDKFDKALVKKGQSQSY